MAITKLYNGKFQVKVVGTDGRWITRCFASRADASTFERELQGRKQSAASVTNCARQITLNEYFGEWFSSREHQASAGWRREQFRLYRDYVEPHLGGLKLQLVSPHLISHVLSSMAKLGKAPQTQVHVFNLLRKLFGDAIELFQLLTFNPVLKRLKPRIPSKESRHLNLREVQRLLSFVEGKPYGMAIWLQFYLGLRVGELQALGWEDVDLESGWVRICRTYVRKDKLFRDYPKGKKQFSRCLPSELLDLLTKAKLNSPCEFVATGPDAKMLSYEWYCRSLKRYCRELGISLIGTHGLRHSTSELYLSYGATKDDLMQLFNHSSQKVTERYLHGRGTHLEKVSNVIRLFPGKVSKSFQNEAEVT